MTEFTVAVAQFNENQTFFVNLKGKSWEFLLMEIYRRSNTADKTPFACALRTFVCVCVRVTYVKL